MNRKFFLGLAATALLAGCSNDEVLDSVAPQEPQAISFENPFVDKGTRTVADLTTSTMTSFFVYAKYADDNGGTTNVKDAYVNSQVAVSNSGSTCTPGTTQYWVKDKYYKFRAYSDGNSQIDEGNLEFSATDGSFTIKNYKVGGNDLILSDLVTRQALSSKNSAIGLTFSHLLSKVKFTFTSKFDPTTKMIISNLQFTANKQGTYKSSESAWSAPSASEAYTYATTAEFVGGASNTAEEVYVLPQDNSSLEATFTITVKDQNDNQIATKSYKVPLKTTGTKWEPAYIYNYTADIASDNLGAESIAFTITEIKGWTTTAVPSTPTENV